jgi:hypothetical protein
LGLKVKFGPLSADDWTFSSIPFKFTNSFTVHPDTDPPKIDFLVSAETVLLSWQAVTNRQYNLEVSHDFGAWASFRTNLMTAGTNITVTAAGTNTNQFFRVTRTAIPEEVTPTRFACAAP